jgi:hypothetical protein
MITGQLRNQIDQLWEKFWTGGITNPLTVIEQISFLMFARLLDIQETNNERMAVRSGKPFKRLFPEDPDGQLLRWQNFRHLAWPAKTCSNMSKPTCFRISPMSPWPIPISANTCATPTWKSKANRCWSRLWK